MLVRDDLPDYRLVLACTRDSQIHTGAAAFQLMASGLYDKLLTVAEVKFMDAAGAGSQWAALLTEHKVIFGLDDNNMPCFVKDGLAAPRLIAVETPPQDDSAVVLDHCVGEA